MQKNLNQTKMAESEGIQAIIYQVVLQEVTALRMAV